MARMEATGIAREWMQLVRLPPGPTTTPSLLSAAALGSETPLLWVACRTSPCLVHVFLDGHLLSIWRFQADPVFLTLGPAAAASDESSSDDPFEGSAASLLVITEDSCIWVVKLAENGPAKDRPHKKQKGGGKRREVRRLQGAFETKKSLEIRTPSSASQSSCLPSAAAKVSKKPMNRKSNTSLIHDDNKQLTRSCQARVTEMSEAVSGFDAEWKKLHVETYEEQEPRLYVEVKNVVVPESLVGVVPGVAVAAFAGDNAVVVMASFGPPEILLVSSSSSHGSSNLKTFKHFRQCSGMVSPLLHREPSCLLFASPLNNESGSEFMRGHMLFSLDLFEALVPGAFCEAASLPNLLLQGDRDGRLYLYQLKSGCLVETASPQVLCDLEEPIMAIFPVFSNSVPTQTNGSLRSEETETMGATGLLVIGQLGRVIIISSQKLGNESEGPVGNGPFLPLHFKFSSSSTEKMCQRISLVLSERRIKGPVTSVCMLGRNRLCHLVSSEVFVTDLFPTTPAVVPKSNSNSSGPEISVSEHFKPLHFLHQQVREQLVSRRVLVSNVVAIAGAGLFMVYTGSRPLVVLMAGGCLQGAKVSDQFTIPATNTDGLLSTRSQVSQNASSKETIKALLQSVADVEACTDAVQSHDRALNLSMNELAVALPLAYNIATNSKQKKIFPRGLHLSDGDNHPSVEHYSLSGLSKTGLSCNISTSPVPMMSIFPDQLSFGGPTMLQAKKVGKPIEKERIKDYLTRIEVMIVNNSLSPVSQYWSLLVSLKSCLSSKVPVAQFSFAINNGLGLPVGAQWNHSFNVALPGGPLGPVVASVFLCHIHDYHKLLLNSQDHLKQGKGTVGAACILLLKQRIDVFSLLGELPPKLGHTPWRPSKIEKETMPHKSPTSAEACSVTSLGDTEILGPFVGSFTFRCKGKTEVQEGLLNQILQQRLKSKAGNQLKLISQDGSTVSISLEAKPENSDASSTLCVIRFRASSFLLGSIVREALQWHLRSFRNLRSIFDQQKSDVDGDRKDAEELVGEFVQAEALAERAKSVAHLWEKFQSCPDSGGISVDLVVPLLAKTYMVTRDALQVYKSLREASMSSSF